MLIGNSRRWLLAAAVFPLVLAGCAGQGAGTGTAGTPAGPGTAASGSHRGLSAVRHVWVIELENQGYQQSFGTPSADPYLARILPRMGALLENYYAIGHRTCSASGYPAAPSAARASRARRAAASEAASSWSSRSRVAPRPAWQAVDRGTPRIARPCCGRCGSRRGRPLLVLPDRFIAWRCPVGSPPGRPHCRAQPDPRARTACSDRGRHVPDWRRCCAALMAVCR